MPDRLHVHHLRFFGRHGVLPEERVLPQRFEVSLSLELDLRSAGETDDLNATINYATVAETAREVVEGESVQLIETLAERIASLIGMRFPSVRQATVRLLKPNPPVRFDFGGVEVEITRVFPPRG